MGEVSNLAERLAHRALTLEGGLDILLVWVLVYWALVLLARSPVHPVRGLAIGLGALGALWMVTRPGHGLLELETFHWLLGQVAPFGLIALVVLFQPEIRQAFGQLGRTNWLSRSAAVPTRSEVVHLVNEVVEACGDLASRGRGALVAIQRRNDLADVIETGKAIDAEVSTELLTTLFYPNTPLHDGAVVLRGSRLAAAGCLLPLTDRRDLAPSVGTRHRAALGLTERSDAVVIVVSEETGVISLALQGELLRDLVGEDLKGRLLEVLQPAGSGLLSAGPGAAP